MQSKLAQLLNSPRFWQLGIVGLSTGLTTYQATGSWIVGLNAAVGIWFGGSVVVGTIDRNSDKKVEAANAIQLEPLG